MAGTAGIDVVLGARTYSLVPQKIGRIQRRLSAVVTVASVATDEDGAGSNVDAVTDRLYEALEVFIPDLAPQWELAGYGSAEDWAKVRDHGRRVAAAREEYARSLLSDGELEHDPADGVLWDRLDPDEQDRFKPPVLDDPYDEARDKSPTPPELVNALEQIFTIHGGQRLVRLLKGVIGTDTIRPILRAEMLRWAQGRSENAQSRAVGARSTSGTTPPATPAPSDPDTPPPAADERTQLTAA